MGKKQVVKVAGQKGVILVWAFQELDELDGRTGFITCDEDLGRKLLKSGKVQDPRIGAGSLKHIVYGKPTAVEAKVTKAKPKNTKEK